MFGFKRKAAEEAEWEWIKANKPNPYEETYTPDMMHLEGREWCMVFLYDEYMQDRRLFDHIRMNSGAKWTAFSKERDFALWKKKLGQESFPIPLVGADRRYFGPGITSRPLDKLDPKEIGPIRLGRIKGEVHAVRPHVIEFLDKYFLNGLEFERTRTRALVPYAIQQGSRGINGDMFVQELRCHMYVGNKDYWCKQLDGGYLFQPVSLFSPRAKWCDGYELGMYYAYTRLEYATNS